MMATVMEQLRFQIRNSMNIFIGGIGINEHIHRWNRNWNCPTIFVLELELESIPMELESELIDPN